MGRAHKAISNPDQTSEDSVLRPVQRTRLYEELAEQLLIFARQANLKPGDRLPTERELARKFSVSRATIRQAIISLEVQGIVAARHGDGLYIRRTDARLEPLTDLLERRQRLPEVLEARTILECRLAELAAARRTEEDIGAINTALERMQAEIKEGGIGDGGDADFHRSVTLAAKNSILANIMADLAGAIAETRAASLNEPDRPPKSLTGHRRIAKAIQERNPPAASAAMREHLEVVADVALLRWQVEGPFDN